LYNSDSRMMNDEIWVGSSGRICCFWFLCRWV